MLTLKNYQQQALEILGRFFRNFRSVGAAEAFQESLAGQGWYPPPSYVDVFRNGEEDSAIPSVCLRIPTGGGKTLLGAYVIAEVGKRLLDNDAPVALWLTLTKTIFQQTLEALNTAGHPYRAALDQLFPQGVRVCTLENLQTVARQEIGRSAVVVVATMQSFRVEDTSDRNVYAFHEELAPHFDGLPPSLEQELDKVTEGDIAAQPYLTSADVGRVKHSIANWLALHRPVVIVDEAHNARTDNTFASLKRVRPACVVELTATPVKGSNVLFHVSAQELKAEDMLKLPIVLFEHPTDWKDAVNAAIQRRTRLDTLSQSESDYIRPIILFQAQPKPGEVTVDVLKNHLVEVEKIPSDQIAVVTGSQKELDGINLFDPQCPIRFVITVEALKEGWDCSFAYILCSLQEVRSAKDVEQLLGRVLRMPFARNRQHPELNQAYAHVIAASFAEAVNALTDKMVKNMGFEAYEVAASFTQPQLALPGMGGAQDPRVMPLLQSTSFSLPKAPNIESLPADVRDQVEVHQTTQGVNVTVSGEAGEELQGVLVANLPKAKKEAILQQVAIHNASVQAQNAPASRGVRLAPFPQLCLQLEDQWQVVEPALLADIGQWNLLANPIRLDGFKLQETAMGWAIDMENRKLSVSKMNQTEQLTLDHVVAEISGPDLVFWLNRETRQLDVSHTDLTAYLTRLVDHLQRDRKMPMPGLWRCKHQLADAIRKEIDRLRQVAQAAGFQQVLPDMAVIFQGVQFDHTWTFHPEKYPNRQPVYGGRHKLPKHLCGSISDLKNTGEETDCAIALDGHEGVKVWVRNVDRDTDAFKLPTSKYWFYPDFVAELNDGRLLVVEYKGAHLLGDPETREKNQVGYQWEQTSGGRCLYMMAVKEDDQGRGVAKQIDEKIAGKY